MSKEIVIKNRIGFLSQKPLDIEVVLEKTSCGIGFYDEHFRITSEPNSGPMMLFDPKCVGRGVQWYDPDNRSKCRLVINTPAAPQDVDLLYKVASCMTEMWKAKSVYVDDEEIPVSSFPEMVIKDKESNISVLTNAKQFWSDNVTITGAYWPLTFSLEEMSAFAGKDGYEEFGRTLHRMLSVDAFFAAPNIFRDGDLVFCVYVPLIDAISIMPNTADGNSRDSDGEEKPFDKSLVILGSPDGSGESIKISLKEYLSKIPEKYIEKYDAEHVQVHPIPIEDLRGIFK